MSALAVADLRWDAPPPWQCSCRARGFRAMGCPSRYLACPPFSPFIFPSRAQGALKYVLSTLPSGMTKKAIVGILKERWRTERMYQELKGPLGLDHFEGRSYPGWHHYASVVISCYAFDVAERARSFPPSAAGARTGTPQHIHARASLRRFLQNNQARPRTRNRDVAPKVPRLSSAKQFERIMLRLSQAT